LRLKSHDVGLRFAQFAVEPLDSRMVLGECGLTIARRSQGFGFYRNLLKLALVQSFLKLAQGLQICGALPLEGSESPPLAKSQTC
jgi:hypothetical protein